MAYSIYRTPEEIAAELALVRAEILRLTTQTDKQNKDVIQENFGDRVIAYEGRLRILPILYAREKELLAELTRAENGGGIGIQYPIFRAVLFVFLLATSSFAQSGLVQPPAADVGTTSTEVFPSANRNMLILQNDSDTDIYCKVDGTTPTVGGGLLLAKYGGTAWWDVGVTVPRAAINCIHGGTGTKRLQRLEVK